MFYCEIIKNTFFLSNISERLLLEEHNILLKTVPIAISNDISKPYHKKTTTTTTTKTTKQNKTTTTTTTKNKQTKKTVPYLFFEINLR